MKAVWKEGFAFGFNPDACDECDGKCCRGSSGYVWLKNQELEKISSYLDLSTVDFINQYIDVVDARLSLREKISGNEYLCYFFDMEKEQCLIYPVRPQQCRDFPFWDRYRQKRDISLDQCPGILEKP